MQHALSGQGLTSLRLPLLGGCEPGFNGPQTALSRAYGMGGLPVLRQMVRFTPRLSQPAHPHVVLSLKFERLFVVNPFRPAMAEHVSPVFTVYVAQVPSLLGLGVMSGSEPAEQQTLCPGARVEHREGSGLYLVKSCGEIPHFVARLPQPSPDSTDIVLQSSRL